MLCGIVVWGGWSSIGAWLNQWQTLLTGGLALIAAYVAVRPVYRQLALMRAQNSVMVRGTVVDMIKQLDADRAGIPEILGKPLNDIHSQLSYIEFHGADGSYTEWISDQRQIIGKVSDQLREFLFRTHDVDHIEDIKISLLEATQALYNDLWTIFLPEQADRFPEDFDWTDEQRQEAYKDSKAADGRLQHTASKVSGYMRELIDTYGEQRAVLLKRLRVIDDSLLVHDGPKGK